MMLGGGIGASTGALIGGNKSDDRGHGAAIGALVGLGIGSLMGWGIHKGKEAQEQKTKREFIFGLDKENSSSALKNNEFNQFKLFNPDIEKHCQPWQVINGNQLVQNHCTWTIKGASSWKKN